MARTRERQLKIIVFKTIGLVFTISFIIFQTVFKLNHNYKDSCKNTSACNNLEKVKFTKNLAFHKNGTSSTKLRNSQDVPIYILWTTWRSGSSFLGQLLAYANKNTFYSYEPLHAFGLEVMRKNNTQTQFALKFLNDIMNCKYENHKYMMNYFVNSEFYYFYNPMTKKTCRPISSCKNSNILNNYCKKATLQVIKLLRLSLAFGESLLRLNSNIKIIYLARDPRATLNSRLHLNWCLTQDCKDPKAVCHLLNEDFQYSRRLQKKFPDRFFFMRYEDLTLNPEQKFKDLWGNLGQKFTPRVKKLIQFHTGQDLHKGIYGLRKNSTKTAFAWTKSLSWKKTKIIQNECRDVIKTLDYFHYKNESQYRKRNILPLLPFS